MKSDLAMASEPRVFLDTSVLFAVVLSEGGGSRLILELGEAGLVQLWIGPQVLRETDGVLTRKAPESKATFALLLDRCGAAVGSSPGGEAVRRASAVVGHPGDAQVLAEALEADVDYFVTLDRRHFVDNPRAAGLPFAVGTPGDFLAWVRATVTGGRVHSR